MQDALDGDCFSLGSPLAVPPLPFHGLFTALFASATRMAPSVLTPCASALSPCRAQMPPRPRVFHRLGTACMQADPRRRPTFAEIVRILDTRDEEESARGVGLERLHDMPLHTKVTCNPLAHAHSRRARVRTHAHERTHARFIALKKARAHKSEQAPHPILFFSCVAWLLGPAPHRIFPLPPPPLPLSQDDPNALPASNPAADTSQSEALSVPLLDTVTLPESAPASPSPPAVRRPQKPAGDDSKHKLLAHPDDVEGAEV